MKKKSILLTCIVAIMALAMFVGCDNAPTLPSFVVSGSIDQTGDFLTGQNFDPKKFSVTVTYDNGKIVPADETVSVYLENGGQKVYGGEVVMADLGKNYESQPVTAKGTVSVYNINRIEVAGGSESYVSVGGENPVIGKASDYTVTAYYYDSDNVEKSMLLGSTEYSVYWDGYVGIKPSASNPSATGKLGIDVNVGGSVNAGNVESVTFTEEVPVTFQAADVDFEFTELVSIAVKENVTILGFADVVPEFDDYTIMVSDGTNSVPLKSDPGIELSFLTNEYKPITDISKQTTVIVKAEYEGLEPVYCSANITPVTLDVNYNSGEVKFYKGQALPELKNSDLTVTYSYNGQTRYLDPADAEFVFATLAGEVYTPIADGKIPATATEIYVVGTYRGISDSYGPINVTDYQAPDVTAIKDVTLATGFALVKQIYEELPEASSAISSVTVVLDDETEEVIPAAELGDDSVVFTSDEAGNTPLTKDLTSATAAYVKVLIGSSAKVVPVTLSDAVVDELTVTLAYSNENAKAPLIDSTMTVTPKLTTTAGGTLSTTDIMYIDTTTGYYATLTSPVTLDEEEHTYKAALWVGDELVESAPFTIPSGVGYVDIAKNEIATEITVAKASTYLALIDAPLSGDPDDYTVSLKTTTDAKGDAKVTITSIEFPEGQKVQAENNKVWANISYVGQAGETVTGRVVVTAFEGKAYVEDMTAANISFVDDEGKAITTVAPGSYTIDDFIVAETSYKAHGEDVTPTVTEIKNQNGYVIASSSQTSFSVENGTIMTLTVSYTNDAGETVPVTATQTITCSNV